MPDPPPAPDPARHRVAPGAPARLAERDPAETGPYASKDDVEVPLNACRERIADLQERLYAEQRRGLLVVFQAMDTGGKDGAIKRVFRDVDPQGCVVHPFKVPTTEDLAHDFLWRVHRRGPTRGTITVFNRSHYEDVLVTRVHGLVGEDVWRPRFRVIREFEHALVRDGMAVVKFFLHISRAEQKRRLEARLADPAKRWKFHPGDVEERARWDAYQRAYEDALTATSTEEAPWYVVPADRKWYRDVVVARTIADTLEEMDPRHPDPAIDLASIVIPD